MRFKYQAHAQLVREKNIAIDRNPVPCDRPIWGVHMLSEVGSSDWEIRLEKPSKSYAALKTPRKFPTWKLVVDRWAQSFPHGTYLNQPLGSCSKFELIPVVLKTPVIPSWKLRENVVTWGVFISLGKHLLQTEKALQKFRGVFIRLRRLFCKFS